jgi:uncharacterized protein (DUF1810 family)
MAVRYGLQDIGEAVAYLRDPILRRRLMAVAAAVARALHREPPARLEQVMGSAIDARKVVSSMTLFGELARRLNRAEPHSDYAALAEAADTILRAAATQGLSLCEVTLQALRQG